MLKHYGFRIPMLSAFPNVLSMKTVPEDYAVIPWFKIFFGLAHVIGFGVIVVFVRDFQKAREEQGR